MDKLEYERRLKEDGCKYICGVDEVGRGQIGRASCRERV